MNKTEFYSTVKRFLVAEGFQYISKNRKFVKEFKDSYIKIELQKSSYSNAYYINYFIYCKELHSYDEIIGLNLGDLFGRFFVIRNEKNIGLFELDMLNLQELETYLRESTYEILNILQNDGLKGYLKYRPEAILLATKSSAQYLRSII